MSILESTLDPNGENYLGNPRSDPGHTHSGLGLSIAQFKANNASSFDNTTPIINTLNALANEGGGRLIVPPGNWNFEAGAIAVPANGISLAGHGRLASTLVKQGNGIGIDISGTATGVANHRRYCGISDLGLNGNGNSGLMVRLYYSDNHIFERNFIYGNNDVTIDTAEFWDSRFNFNCWENNGLLTSSQSPNLWLRNSAASTGFGFSSDSVNQIHLFGNRFEGFTNGAVAIQHGPGNTNNENGIYLVGNKMETSSIIGSNHLLVDSTASNIHVAKLYVYAGAFAAGFSTPITAINWQPVGSSTLKDVQIANSGAGTIADGVSVFSNGITKLEDIFGAYGTSPTDAHMTFVNGATGTVYLINCPTNKGTQFSGTAPTGGVQSPTWTSVSV